MRPKTSRFTGLSFTWRRRPSARGESRYRWLPAVAGGFWTTAGGRGPKPPNSPTRRWREADLNRRPRFSVRPPPTRHARGTVVEHTSYRGQLPQVSVRRLSAVPASDAHEEPLASPASRALQDLEPDSSQITEERTFRIRVRSTSCTSARYRPASTRATACPERPEKWPVRRGQRT